MKICPNTNTSRFILIIFLLHLTINRPFVERKNVNLKFGDLAETQNTGSVEACADHARSIKKNILVFIKARIISKALEFLIQMQIFFYEKSVLVILRKRTHVIQKCCWSIAAVLFNSLKIHEKQKKIDDLLCTIN